MFKRVTALIFGFLCLFVSNLAADYQDALRNNRLFAGSAPRDPNGSQYHRRCRYITNRQVCLRNGCVWTMRFGCHGGPNNGGGSNDRRCSDISWRPDCESTEGCRWSLREDRCMRDR